MTDLHQNILNINKKIDELNKNNNSLQKFIDECCIVSEKVIPGNKRVKKTTFKRAYYKWCELNNCFKQKMKSKDIELILKFKFKENIEEVIKGLESLIDDRLSFLAPDDYKDEDNIFLKDVKILREAIQIIKREV